MKKTNIKRIAAFTASILAVAALTVPMTSVFTADADSGDYTITITYPDDSDMTHSDLAAYQIFDGTWNSTESNLTVSGWGDGIKAADFIAALKKDATIGSDFDAISATADETSAQAVAKIVSGYTTASKEAEAFAKLAVQNKDKASGSFASATSTIEGVGAGYYVIADATAADADINNDGTVDDGYSSYTLGLLYVADDTTMTVKTKIDYPTVVKKVQEDDSTTDDGYGVGYNDVADWDVNTPVPFKIVATLPSNIDDYSHYYLKFTDTLDDNFGTPENVVVSIGSSSLTQDTHYTIKSTGNDMTIEILDVKGCGVTVEGGTEVTVTYTAKLNVTGTVAVIGLDGQENVVNMTYSNNPNNAGDGTAVPSDTDTTPDDKVIVFTYELDITKIDGATKAEIEGAEFKLANSDGKYAQVDANGYFTAWVDETTATVLTSDEDGIFKVIGLDDGEYYLYEQKWSEDYNIPTTPFTVVIDATTLFTQDSYNVASDALTALTGSVGGVPDTSADKTNGIISGTIENNMGTTLPSTGGIGTTLFYIGGGALALGAGVLLVSKKRMANK